jgi:hypothetical protein
LETQLYLLTHADHDTSVSGTSDNGGEDGSGGIVSSETGLAHTGSVINNKGLNFVVAHFGWWVKGFSVGFDKRRKQNEKACELFILFRLKELSFQNSIKSFEGNTALPGDSFSPFQPISFRHAPNLEKIRDFRSTFWRFNALVFCVSDIIRLRLLEMDEGKNMDARE